MKPKEHSFRQVGNILIPTRFPERLGLGCPKCDDHETIAFTQMTGGTHAVFEAFAKKHAACGPLQTIEIHGGRAEVTGELRVPE